MSQEDNIKLVCHLSRVGECIEYREGADFCSCTYLIIEDTGML